MSWTPRAVHSSSRRSPVHVELPLLLALCTRTNGVM